MHANVDTYRLWTPQQDIREIKITKEPRDLSVVLDVNLTYHDHVDSEIEMGDMQFREDLFEYYANLNFIIQDIAIA
jgi:hypothetical protein